MDAWQWFSIVVGVGIVLLAVALLLDRRARLRLTGGNQPAPLRSHAEVDRHVPAYITQDQVDALPAPNAQAQGRVPHRGEGFGFGHAAAEFANERDGASWDNPSLLIVDGQVDSMRELLTPLSRATATSPLIVVAEAFHPSVLTTLAANRRALHLPVVAAVAAGRDRLRLAELTGASQLSPSDLQAGYLPAECLGAAAHWSSTGSRSWVTPAQT